MCTLRFAGLPVTVHAWCTLVHAVHAFMGLERVGERREAQFRCGGSSEGVMILWLRRRWCRVLMHAVRACVAARFYGLASWLLRGVVGALKQGRTA